MNLDSRHRRPSHLRALAALAAVTLVAAACGASPRPAATSAKHPSGRVDVAFAGSLELLDNTVVGPGFEHATGYGYEGRGGGSFGLAHEIADGEIHPQVFESIGTAPIQLLVPKFTRWWVQLAASPIVLAYSPKSRFAPELSAIAKGTKPLADLFGVLESPGFRLGRTNPETDPQGQAFCEMVELATKRYHLSADTPRRILGSTENHQQIFSETALESDLEAGEVDAASAFLSQAVQLHLPYVALPSAIDFGDPSLRTQYATATLALPGGKVVHGVPLVVDATILGRPTAPATAFLTYLLWEAGRHELTAGGYTLVPPTIGGPDPSAAPTALRRAARASHPGTT